MPTYKSDDLGFDLEIRKNIFVNSQIYPAQKKIIVSFLEQIEDTDYRPMSNQSSDSISTKTENVTPVDAQDMSRLATATITKETADTTDPANHRGFLQEYHTGTIDEFKIKSIPESLAYVTKRIHEVVKSVDDYDIVYENLAIPSDFVSFSKRYGINDAYAYMNKTKAKAFFGPLKVVYSTDGDYDPNKHGLRIGYNSSNYDEPMLAHYLGDLFYDHLYHTTVNTYSEHRNSPTGNLKIAKYVKRHFNQQFYDSVWNKNNSPIPAGNDISPSTLLLFSNQLFDSKPHMYDALGNVWKLGMNNQFGDQEPQRLGLATYGAWERSNRYIDVANLNPKFETLKRRAMALGYKIQESDSNRDPTAALKTLSAIADLIAYNVNDIYVTLKLFESGTYYNRYLQNQQLLAEFPYMIYEQRRHSDKKLDYRVVRNADGTINRAKSEDFIRYRPLTINATSTKFVENTIAPYKNTKIQDNPVLNLNYPDAKIAKELDAQGKLPAFYHGKPMNALDLIQHLLNEDKKQFSDEYAAKVQEQYDKIKKFYTAFIGQNFNGDLTDDPDHMPIKPSNLPERRVIVKYVTPGPLYRDNHGNGLTSYVTISVGGTHGVEVLEDAYAKDFAKYDEQVAKYTKTIDYLNGTGDYETPVTMDNLAQVIAEMLPDEPFTHVKRTPLPIDSDMTYGDLLLSSASRKKPKLRKPKEPKLFVLKDGKLALKDGYAYTSSNLANHEDFDSYYPSLISNLAIFRNADGNDVFTHDLYHPRLKLKVLAKDESLPAEERAKHMLRQLSMKLLINAASGGGDASFTSKIRCNNKMLAMRIIGQLFSWYIGQSLAMKDARVPSTNTDGLYSMNIEKDLNDRIVKGAAEKLALKIDPEVVPLFVSKDANNRLERNDKKITSARGSALTSWKGPSTDNSIDHPAIVDYVLANYLAYKNDAVNQPFDEQFATQIFKNFFNHPTKLNQTISDSLRYLQFPIAANPKSCRFIFQASIETDKDKKPTVTLLNPTNRIFLVKEKSSGVTVKSTGLNVVHVSTAKNRNPDAEYFRDIIRCDETAEKVMRANMTDRDFGQLLNKSFDPKATIVADKPRDIKLIKITNLEENQPVVIYNEDLHDVSQKAYLELMKKISIPAYIKIVQDKFESQWLNKISLTKQA